MGPIRVLYVVTIMNKGGLESRIMDIIRNVDVNRVKIDIYTNRQEEGYFDKEIKKRGGKIYYNPPISIFCLQKKILEFYKFLNEHKEYSIIHVHQNELSTLFCMAARKANTPVRIAHSRGANTQISLSKFVKDIIKLPLKKYATDFFAVSKPAAIKLFGKSSYKKGQVEIWPNAIDCKRFTYNPRIRDQIRSELNLGNAFTIIHVGNFTTAKNHDFLLQIFKALKKREPLAKLVLIGGGELKQYIDKTAKLELTDSVLFLGSRSNVHDLLQVGDVFVFPSLYEGFPGAVLEAQASGLPCIISDTITSEVCLLPITKQLSLSMKPNEWVNAILSYKNFEREDTYDTIAAAGYDIVSLTEQLTNFYEKSINKELINK